MNMNVEAMQMSADKADDLLKTLAKMKTLYRVCGPQAPVCRPKLIDKITALRKGPLRRTNDRRLLFTGYV
jgi:hypothetical protein